MSRTEELKDEVYVIKEAAKILKMSVSTLYSVIGQKRLKTFRTGGGRGTYHITRASLLDYIRRQEDEEERR